MEGARAPGYKRCSGAINHCRVCVQPSMLQLDETLMIAAPTPHVQSARLREPSTLHRLAVLAGTQLSMPWWLAELQRCPFHDSGPLCQQELHYWGTC